MDSYFSLLNLSFVENNHISISTTFAKQSMINRLSNHINRNRPAPKISEVMSSNIYRHILGISWAYLQAYLQAYIQAFLQAYLRHILIVVKNVVIASPSAFSLSIFGIFCNDLRSRRDFHSLLVTWLCTFCNTWY